MEFVNALKEVGNVLVENIGTPGLLIIGGICAVMLIGAFVWHRSEQSQWEELGRQRYHEALSEDEDYDE